MKEIWKCKKNKLYLPLNYSPKKQFEYDKVTILNKSIKYHYDSRNEIMYKIHFGNININTIKDSWDWAFINKIIPVNTKRFILDYSEARLDMTARHAEEISKFYYKNIDVFRDCKFAIISDNPHNVVISTLVKKGDDGYESRPFSTREAAIAWLLQ